ncbi:MAG: tRNA glutamyl-Q(34) synthetase GluQRS [Pseudomonadota bacterium]|nr:MAG: tRNA glutamyl-Q(34) synthetase GluQRS [Pseudomonadota bacterium]
MAAPPAKYKIQPGQPGSLYVGRFAPSPTGPLHFGSLVAAVGSYLRARSRNGQWRIRIDDIDRRREIPGAARDQLRTLARFGLGPDGPVSYQHRNAARHRQALHRLLDARHAFWCGCTRRQLPPDGRYPGTCRNGLPAQRKPRSVRVNTQDAPTIRFDDVVQGACEEHPGQRSGDFIILRGDGVIAYQLAVVVDDASEGITEVVRGADLIDSTARQLYLYENLGLPAPGWMHLPVVTDEHGRKLSKSDGDDPVAARPEAEALRLALRALGHEPPPGCRSLDAQWHWARSHWSPAAIPRGPIAVGVHPG